MDAHAAVFSGRVAFTNSSGCSSFTFGGMPRFSQLKTRWTPPRSYPSSSATFAGPPRSLMSVLSSIPLLHTMLRTESTACESTLCVPQQHPAVEDAEVHDSALRLLAFAQVATASRRQPVTDWASLGACLGASAATVTNWKRRGVSKDGALDAEREFGCSAVWVLEGTGAEVPTQERAPPWPFEDLTPDAWARLSQKQRTIAEYSMIRTLRDMAPDVLGQTEAFRRFPGENSSMGEFNETPEVNKPPKKRGEAK